jgi:hypothetical protein
MRRSFAVVKSRSCRRGQIDLVYVQQIAFQEDFEDVASLVVVVLLLLAVMVFIEEEDVHCKLVMILMHK